MKAKSLEFKCPKQIIIEYLTKRAFGLQNRPFILGSENHFLGSSVFQLPEQLIIITLNSFIFANAKVRNSYKLAVVWLFS